MNSKQNNLILIIKNHARLLLCLTNAAVFAIRFLTLTSLPRAICVIRTLGSFAALAVGLVFLPTLATMQSKTPVDFTISGKVQTDGAQSTLPPGSLDPTFDVDGRVTTAIGEGSFDLALAVATQPDGKIVTAGLSNGVHRY